ncbi:hypothetical protein [Sulfurihydrogenibium azorense]|uniref:Lipoprotein n=2 Tax=Sulfurihydrogenibium azorense TaxID=309806 RepID=C1DTH4_SULAA|nr:hypothetical protein [Sulfurihydrogenibium azorense]ACN98429.1 hypothetical protein SULAZ_0419 [Sulfurihydrogenibium azorense Az-Fu1]MDM7273692.1 curli assembly protein CsgG [Sulfurihydrogenibium azorense]
MKKLITSILLLFSITFATECQPKISMSDVEKTASSYVGNITSVKLSKNRSGECYYKVYGEKGYVTIDALNGELLKFTKKREK